MSAERRLVGVDLVVGVDLGIASDHTVRVLRGDGSEVCRRWARPTVESLAAVEAAALAGAGAGTRLEVVMGPAWLPVAVFFLNRGHRVFRNRRAQPLGDAQLLVGRLREDDVDRTGVRAGRGDRGHALAPRRDHRDADGKGGERRAGERHRVSAPRGALAGHPVGMWADPADDDVETPWVRRTKATSAPFETGGSYLNDDSLQSDRQRVREVFGAAKYARLAGIKARYDPDNVFHHAANIAPRR